MTRYGIALTFGLICTSLTPLPARAVTVPDGTALLVHTLDPISSSDKAGKTFAARLDNNLVVNGKLTAPAGSIVYGRVESSGSAGRAPGQSKLVLSLTQIVVNERLVTIATGNYEGSDPRSGGKNTDKAKAIGATFGGLAASTAVGAAGTALGAALGGPAAGAAIGFVTAVIGRAFTGPAVGATIGFIDRGKSAVAPAGTQFEFRLARPVYL
jgi:hypothetical protein